MSLEELIAALSREAAAERERILDGARGEAARLLAAAREEVERLRRGPRGEAARRLSAGRARKLHAARMGGQALVRKSMGETVDAVAARVLELAEELPQDGDHGRRLGELMAEAAAGVAAGTFTVRPPDLRQAEEAAARLGGAFGVVAEAGLPPGVRFVSADGLMEVDNTLPARLTAYLSLKEAEVAALLFGGSGNV